MKKYGCAGVWWLCGGCVDQKSSITRDYAMSDVGLMAGSSSLGKDTKREPKQEQSEPRGAARGAARHPSVICQ